MTTHLINGKPYPKEKPLDNKKIIIQDWILEKEYIAASVWNHHKGQTGGYVSDFIEGQKSYRLVGTKKQIRQWADKQTFILDEVYTYEPFDKKHTYFKDICFSDKYEHLPTRKEYNKKYYDDLKFYKELYKENKNELLVLRNN